MARRKRSQDLPRVFFAHHRSRAQGFSFGYANLITQVEQAIQPDDTAGLALSVLPVDMYKPVPGRFNVLLTMWESTDMRRRDIEALRGVDALIVPSTFCRDLYAEVFNGPIHLVPLGVDDSVFKYRRRKPPLTGQPFIWFWTASPDPRKGWVVMSKVWQEYFASDPGMVLYMKTSAHDTNTVRSAGNVIFDCRTLTATDLASLYQGAHGFVYTTFGEGFGLTCAEAMATGLPVVGCSHTGHADFFHHLTGTVVPHERQRLEPIKERSTAADGLYECNVPFGGDLAVAMREVMSDYRRATTKAAAGAAVIHNAYTWRRFKVGLGRALRALDRARPA